MIRAIETGYKGHRFRSRLEARWAVFLDTLGVEWVYEPECFKLASGRQYMPDFKIYPSVLAPIQFYAWFEVKPPGVPIEDRHRDLARESGCPLVLASMDAPSATGLQVVQCTGAIQPGTFTDPDGRAERAAASARFEYGESGAPLTTPQQIAAPATPYAAPESAPCTDSIRPWWDGSHDELPSDVLDYAGRGRTAVPPLAMLMRHFSSDGACVSLHDARAGIREAFRLVHARYGQPGEVRHLSVDLINLAWQALIMMGRLEQPARRVWSSPARWIAMPGDPQ